jgi:hypothetical protein
MDKWKQLGTRPMKQMTAKPNINFASHPHYQTLVIQVLYPLLRHLNAGTISVILMIALALVNAVRGTESASRGSVVDDAMMAGMASDGSRVWLKTSPLRGVQEFTCFRESAQSRISAMHHRRSESTGENN